MNILILGATGRTGEDVLNKCIELNLNISVLVRNPQKINSTYKSLNVIQGDAQDENAVKNALIGVDVIVSVLGHSSKSGNNILENSAKIILKNISDNQRYIALTGFGVKFSKDAPETFGGNLISGIIKLLPTNLWNDGNAMGKQIFESPKPWILIRAPRIVKGLSKGKYRIGYFPVDLFDKISTGDIADFIGKNLSSNEWIHESPILAY